MKKILIPLIILVILILGFWLLYIKFFISEIPHLNMEVTSNAFLNNGEIPQKYTCQGENINPYLKISKIPKQAKTLVLIMDDPDAPLKTWVHWVVFNIPVSNSEIEILEGEIPQEGIQGINDFKKLDYGGPCPPSGTHRYFFKIYALDSKLNLSEGATKIQVEKAMKNYILDSSELVGVYSKK